MKSDDETRTAQARQANKVLRALLRSPKTRAGLVAAVSSRKISRQFVIGWLTEKQRTGHVVLLKSGANVTYQLSSTFHVERPDEGAYPSWLEPRSLPDVSARQAYINGIRAELYNPEEEDQE